MGTLAEEVEQSGNLSYVSNYFTTFHGRPSSAVTRFPKAEVTGSTPVGSTRKKPTKLSVHYDYAFVRRNRTAVGQFIHWVILIEQLIVR